MLELWVLGILIILIKVTFQLYLVSHGLLWNYSFRSHCCLSFFFLSEYVIGKWLSTALERALLLLVPQLVRQFVSLLLRVQ